MKLPVRDGVRSRGDQVQRGDYAPEDLEWIFYWYLATVQLTDRLRDDSSR